MENSYKESLTHTPLVSKNGFIDKNPSVYYPIAILVSCSFNICSTKGGLLQIVDYTFRRTSKGSFSCPRSFSV